MELINEASSSNILEKNTVIGDFSLIKSTIEFNGIGNFLYCEDGVVLENTTIRFNGNNSFFYLSKSKKKLC